MTTLLTLSETVLTMSSREIAELIGKNHSDLYRSIERLIAKQVIKGYQPMAYTHPQNKQTYYEYHLDKRDSLIVVAQNCPEFTAAIVDRWQELEQKQVQPDLTTALNDPTFLRNTLITYSEKVIELTPKANAYDRIATKGEGSLNLTDSAKHLQVPPRKLNQFLFSLGWIYRRTGGKSWVAYQDKLKQGYLEHKIYSVTEQSGEEKIYPQVLITAKGLSKLSQLLEQPQQHLLTA